MNEKEQEYLEYLESLCISMLARLGDKEIFITDPKASISLKDYSISPYAARDCIKGKREERNTIKAVKRERRRFLGP